MNWAGAQRHTAVQLGIGVAAIAAITAVSIAVGLPAMTVAFFYLIVIVLVALMGSFGAPALLAVLAVACLNFFFMPPILAFSVTSVDAAELGAFLLTALITTRLVTQAREAEKRAAERARMLDLTHDAVYVRDLDARLMYWNRGAEELYGWTAEQALGRVSHDLLQATFPVPLEDIRAELDRTGRWQGDVGHVTRDGTRLVVAASWALDRDADGNAVAHLVATTDVSGRRRVEQMLRDSEARYRALIEVSPQIVWIAEADGAITFLNQWWLQYTGLALEEGLGEGWLGLVHPDHRDGTRAAWLDAVATGRDWNVQVPFRRADGQYRWHLCRARAICDAEGRVSRWVGIALDIHERLAAEDALQRTRDALTHVTRIATVGEVTGSFAHELSQPLAAIANNANACLGVLPDDRPELADVREALSDIVGDTERAANIIERVRALMKRTTFERVPVRLADVVTDVVALTAADCAARGFAIRTDVPTDLPVVLGDRVQLQQVLMNLLVNGLDAMRDVEPSERALEVRGRLDRDGGGGPAVVVLSVTDRGVGLPAEPAGRIFEAFYTTKPHGMGLGLAISRAIVDMHGGRLSADANPGGGATFAVRLPAADALPDA